MIFRFTDFARVLEASRWLRINKKKTLCLIIYTNLINISRAADKKIYAEV